MASASGRGDPYAPSSVRHSSRTRTPPSRDKREGYGAPQQAGEGVGRVGVVEKRPGRSKSRRKFPVKSASLNLQPPVGAGRFRDGRGGGGEGGKRGWRGRRDCWRWGYRGSFGVVFIAHRRDISRLNCISFLPLSYNQVQQSFVVPR